MKPNQWEFMDRALEERKQGGRWRSLQAVEPVDGVRVTRRGQTLINFSANDYLGLSKHPALIRATQDYTQRYGAGSTASRLVTGTYSIHQQLEDTLAIACGWEAALVFSSGFQANATVLASLLDREALVLCDRLIHNSMIQGILLSRARVLRFQHNDLDHLEKLLQRAAHRSPSRVVIVTESLFSMDGDRSDLSRLTHLAQQYGAILYVDDAHAMGVLGRQGMGLTAHQPGIDLVVGTFGKACGCFGAYVLCSAKIREYLINCCPGFIYTTALPPGVIGAIAAALERIPTLEQERHNLTQLGNNLRAQLHSLGYDTGLSTSHIIPVIMGDDDKTLRLSHWLEEQGILATAIRPPTVPLGTARIRLALSSAHTGDQVNQLLHALQTWNG